MDLPIAPQAHLTKPEYQWIQSAVSKASSPSGSVICLVAKDSVSPWLSFKASITLIMDSAITPYEQLKCEAESCIYGAFPAQCKNTIIRSRTDRLNPLTDPAMN